MATRVKIRTFRSFGICMRGVEFAFYFAVACVFASQPAAASFSPYDVIIARQPFGVPPVVAPPAAAQAEQGPPPESFVKRIQIAAITEDETGIRVGVVNLKTQQAFFLSPGDSTDEGIVLVDAQYDEGGALLRCGEEEYWMYLDGRVGEAGDVPEIDEASASMATADGAGSSSEPGRSAQTAKDDGSGRPLSYMERWRQRREALAKAEQQRIEDATKQKLENVNRDDLLRQYNLELIRAGGAKGAPLPIQLTPEEDAMLVQEGVLPPVESQQE